MPRKKLAPSREATGIALGKAIRDTRMRAGLTIAEVARASGIDQRHLSNFERGERKISVYFLFRLAHGLGERASNIVQQAEAHL
jgi:transcriptional regulator with XRE-family HTH domain